MKPRAIAVRAPVACRGPVSRCRPRRRSATSAASAAWAGVAPTVSASRPAARPQTAEPAMPARAASASRARPGAASASSTPIVEPGDTCVNGFCHGACVIRLRLRPARHVLGSGLCEPDVRPHPSCLSNTDCSARPDLRRRGLPGELPLERRLLHLHDRDRLRSGRVLRDAGRGVAASASSTRSAAAGMSCVDALCS